ncbi:UDP-N-acetylmuramoyl-tripeptide--D-alanyl-D-alanine ligase [Rickettsia conorii subsp. heilongjiangensis]|uniref:UDP-N-acetylmuramoyl-tripeptide--D-alanyl-D-alanine ligase n=1 Tax=Rickettsia conorii subsp. heilongjiangensis TaxID=226665 RepID=A0AAD1LSQ4_RICCR|nr:MULTISPECIES: UDP-N-acetylmuramoyl-tripeptide--D-alanyl-D-alanine ligase [spotted fever group]AEK74911.1 UDP-N-acetylmuramoylalanyl-D-glutamyl- 2,6-diaminopimelate--D-alanyl-D-alanyl ligase [Rickettsia conorii subsp. heilongjiangensis 054]UZW38289.1 UDP-N-acetylmuramoyl-tripeptide--D-alanyl-D-alanine ligase [Rickettsia conorii subsp. heilongjiangensis]BBM91652.1 UDP-N-acetylmuramoyl-tripeptide--D-alanyl-D-alanine ligase [Rickettsia conorii subsp. heilongjiangensis]BBM92860.1 UDP-N-acetylmura
MIWNSKTLSAVLGITISNSINCNEVQFNSKDVKKGDLFIALQGNRDGHDYVLDAIDKGAAAVIISKRVEINDKDKIILVDNCFEALQKMALYKRENSKAKFIAITGSVGKTSTKEALKVLLQHDFLVFASRGNFNNKLGMLINLASMADDTEYAIFELGMNHKGEIRELVQILKPNIAMITNISEAHLEFFNSLEEIAEAKCEIFANFSKNDIAVINADTNCYNKILSILKNLSITDIHSFGRSAKTSAELILYENLGEQVYLKYKINNKVLDVTIPFIPRHFTENYTGVLLIIDILGKDIEIAANHLANISPTKGRGEIINIQNCRVICDYYNASPQSMKAALEYLKQVPAEHKTAIIGDMLELGENSKRLHEKLVQYILDAACSKVYLVGVNTKYIDDLLPSKIAKKYFKNVDELITHITDLFEGNELILIKGSRGVKLDKIVDYYK